MRLWKLRVKMHNGIRRLARRLSYWAWKDILNSRYSNLEIAEWMLAYHSIPREKTLSEWVEERRRETGDPDRSYWEKR